MKKLIYLMGLSAKWFFSIVFLFVGVTMLSENLFYPIFILFAGLVIFPPFEKYIFEKFQFRSNIWIQIFFPMTFLSLAVGLDNETIKISVSEIPLFYIVGFLASIVTILSFFREISKKR